MSLRWKIAMALAALAMAATIAIGTVSYRSTRDRLLAEVDRSLEEVEPLLNRLSREPLPERGPLSGLDAQIVDSSGQVLETTFTTPLPVGDAEREVIGHPRRSVSATVDTPDGEYRIRTIGYPRGALQVGRSLGETNRVLDGLRGRIVVWSLSIGALAMALGWWIASTVTASLRRLTGAAEQVETTGRFDVAVPVTGADEVGRLGSAFERMLAALARSKDDQRRLVQDAGHELRTPLTSLRTNLEVLQRYPDMPIADRDAILADLHAETEELTDLVNEIVAVASGETSDEPFVDLALDELVADVVDRYARRTDRAITLAAVPTVVHAQRTAVQRAVSCLLDNALKFDPSDSAVTVTVADGEVRVADRGPGIDPTDLEHVFDRFYRADAARTLPGSGLGLSIVDVVARRHGGEAFASTRPGGGAEVGFRLGARSPG